MRGAVLPGWVESLPTVQGKKIFLYFKFFFGGGGGKAFNFVLIFISAWMTGSTEGIEPGLGPL